MESPHTSPTTRIAATQATDGAQIADRALMATKTIQRRVQMDGVHIALTDLDQEAQVLIRTVITQTMVTIRTHTVLATSIVPSFRLLQPAITPAVRVQSSQYLGLKPYDSSL